MKNNIKERALELLNLQKQKFSKVNMITYKKLEMQDYFLPNENNITKKETRLIFQMRSRVTKVKMNMKSSFDQYECKSCYKENESQDHIYECSEIWKIRNENKNEQENYNNIYVGNLTQKLKVARIFEQNLKLYNEMFNK